MGGRYLLPAPHPTGTIDWREVAREHTDADIIINVQGDEPSWSRKLLKHWRHQSGPRLQMVTLCTPLLPEEAAQDSGQGGHGSARLCFVFHVHF